MNISGKDVPLNEPETSQPPLETTLNLLSAVGSGLPISQRFLASRLGVALGLANALIRRCVHKGFIKIGSAPARRYAYYLTPAGFAEKSRLVGEYIETSLSFFRSARIEFAQILADAAKAGQTRILLIGAGELAEIALLAAEDSGCVLTGVIDSARNIATFHAMPVFRNRGEAPGHDAVLITDARNAEAIYQSLIQELPQNRILVPSILHISRNRTDPRP